MADLIRSAALSGYADIVRAAGHDPVRAVRAAGLPVACLTDPELKIASSTLRRLLEETARKGIDDLGLRLAAERSLSNLGPIGLIAREQPTVRRALEAMGHYMRLHNESLSLRMLDSGEEVIVGVDLRVGPSMQYRQSAELAVGVLYRVLKLFLGTHWKPELVVFMHGAPRSTEPHRRFFRTRVEFSGDFMGIVCTSRDLDAPIASADPVMARHAARYLDTMLGPGQPGIRRKVQDLICVLLPSGRATAEAVARQMGLERRTLDRRLEREGTTFLSEMNEVRAQLCIQYLASEDRSLTAVADLLGFSGLSAFSRWYSGRFGAPPSTRRQNKAHAP